MSAPAPNPLVDAGPDPCRSAGDIRTHSAQLAQGGRSSRLHN